MSNTTVEEMLVKLDGHIKHDELSLSHVALSLIRIETAVADHAKISADTLDKMNVRTHARIDSLVTSITKLADSHAALKDDLHEAVISLTKNNEDVKSDLHKRISGAKDWWLTGALAIAIPVIGWLVMMLYERAR